MCISSACRSENQNIQNTISIPAETHNDSVVIVVVGVGILFYIRFVYFYLSVVRQENVICL